MLSYPQSLYYLPQSIAPRDRYLAALAEARVAEAEYASALAAQRIREQRQRDEAIIRRQLLLESLYSQEAAYPTHDLFSSTTVRPLPFASLPAEQLSYGLGFGDGLPYQRGEQDLISGLRRRQQRHRLELLRDQEDKQLARAAFIRQHEQRRRQEAEALVRMQAVKERDQVHCGHSDGLEQVLGLLYGERPENVFNRKEQRAAQPSQRKQFTQGELLAHLFGAASEPVEPNQSKVAPQHDLLARILGGVPKEQQRIVHPETKPAPEQAQTSSSTASFPSLKEHLEARLRGNSGMEIHDTVGALISSLFNPAHAAPESQPEPRTSVPQATASQPESRASSAPVVTPSSSRPVSLKEQLETRLLGDSDAEIRDTVQALLASLFTSQSPSTPDIKASTSAHGDTSAESSAKGKGKAKEVTFNIPVSVPTSRDVMNALDTLRNIEASFHALESDFVFPSNLDFDANSSSSLTSSSSASKLAYTSKNAPVRYYEHALSSLLTQLDSVNSFGNEDVRNKRKEVVAKVETALEAAEREIEGRLRVWLKKVVVAETGGKAGEGTEKADEHTTPPIEKTSVSEPVAAVANIVAQSSVAEADETRALPSIQGDLAGTAVTGESSDQIPSAPQVDSTTSSELTKSVVLNVLPTTSDDKPTLEEPGSLSQSTTEDLIAADARNATTDTSNNVESILSYSSASPTVIPLTSEPIPEIADTLSPSPLSPDATPDTDVLDTFLLPASAEGSPEKKPTGEPSPYHNDRDEPVEVDASRDDAGSDWSEVEA